jgi:predicted dehydrogenase
MKVGIVGCGLIGQKRAQALAGNQLVAAADVVMDRAWTLAQKFPGAEVSQDWQTLLQRSDVDIVIVATTNNWLAPITLAAIETGKHVLVEKPAARTPHELEPILAAAQRAGVKVRVGFNHRYHPALQQAKKLIQAGEIGPLMFVRGRYGHGGRVGYDREWRADPDVAGGGELIDQGVHLIDLSRWLLGDFTEVEGQAHTYFWDMPMDDNAFLMLRTAQTQTAWLHVSCTEWKNMFSFEIYGRTGKLHLEGLGGSYGLERLAFYRMLPEMGPPETTIWEYPRPDNSWEKEFAEFVEDISLDRPPAASLTDALAALQIVERIYQLSNSKIINPKL